MQTRAISGRRCRLEREGETVSVEIMIPLVSLEGDRSSARSSTRPPRRRSRRPARARLHRRHHDQLPGPPDADRSPSADFFSFGTNDLTQTGLGISRDDAENGFLTDYVVEGVLERNPFESIDVDGVGELVRIGVEKGRNAKADLKCGVCGEHGGDPDSIDFFQGVGLNYVSCSPFRVPIARFAAARAAMDQQD